MNTLSTYLPKLEVSFCKESLTTPIILNTSQKAFEVFNSIRDWWTINLYEEMKVFYLDTKMSLIWYRNLGMGSSNNTTVNIKLLFALALSCNAEWFILWHNHPSWQLRPSKADTWLTSQIKEWAKLLDLKLIDHIILANNKYYSFADEWLI